MIMFTLLNHKLSDGSSIGLPIATFAICYTVVQDGPSIKVICGLKTPGLQSPFEELRQIRGAYPALTWKAVPGIGARGHTNGATKKFMVYEMTINDEGVVVIDGDTDVGAAFFHPSADAPLIGDQVDSLDAFGFAPKGEAV